MVASVVGVRYNLGMRPPAVIASPFAHPCAIVPSITAVVGVGVYLYVVDLDPLRYSTRTHLPPGKWDVSAELALVQARLWHSERDFGIHFLREALCSWRRRSWPA